MSSRSVAWSGASIKLWWKDVIVATGTVKWFNANKGYGFIRPEDGSEDVFVHISAVERSGLSTLSEGRVVSYELVEGRNGKMSAEHLALAD
jgi:CspA family cold shock protein